MNLFHILTCIYSLRKEGTRDGIFCISNRFSKANNTYLKSYDSKQKSKHFIYLDTNNVYGYAMFKFLPTSGFKWINPQVRELNKCTSKVLKNVFLKLILNILKNYKKYTMIILSLIIPINYETCNFTWD